MTTETSTPGQKWAWCAVCGCGVSVPHFSACACCGRLVESLESVDADGLRVRLNAIRAKRWANVESES